MKWNKAEALHRRRSEVVERRFAHDCEIESPRRTWLQGIEKKRERFSIVSAERYLGLLMLMPFGMGKPRTLQLVRDEATGKK